jgi:hypothetical protein
MQEALRHNGFRASCMERGFTGEARSTAGPCLKIVFAEGESGIPKGYSLMAAGGDVTRQIRRGRFPFLS